MVLTMLIVFLGLPIGIALAYIAKEELEPGKKAFVVLQLILMILIITFIFTNRSLPILASLMFLFGFPSGSLIIYEKFKFKKISPKTFIIYSAVYISFIMILIMVKL